MQGGEYNPPPCCSFQEGVSIMNKPLTTFSLIFLIVLAGCKSKDAEVLTWTPNEETHQHIESVIANLERRNAMLAIMDSFNAEMESIADAVKVQREKILMANAKYDTTREELQRMYDELNAKVGQLGDAAKTHSFELRTHCSEAEWEKIFTHAKRNEIKYF
jgi:hypothetical protein